MSAQIEINIRSPLGVVRVQQKAGESWDYGPEIEHDYLLEALSNAIRQSAAAYGVTPKALAAALEAAIERENQQ